MIETKVNMFGDTIKKKIDYIELIKKYNLKVMPILVDDLWLVGKVISSDGITNYIPYELLAKEKTLEEVIIKAVEKIERK